MDGHVTVADRRIEDFGGIDAEPAALAQRPAAAAPRVEREPVTLAEGLNATTRAVFRSSPSVANLFAALAAAQGKFKSIERTREARIKSKRDGGADYEYDYETLADVIEATKEALAENGLCVIQLPFPAASGQSVVLHLRTLVGHGSGEWFSNDMVIALDNGEPRTIGSGSTYLCRYARKAVLGLAAEYDDDAEAAGPKDAPRASTRRSQQQQPPPAPGPRGEVVEVVERGDATFVKLDNGYVAATRAPELITLARSLMNSGKRVDLGTTQRDKYAPTLHELTVVVE